MNQQVRLGAICIDCQVDDLATASAFWSALLDREPDPPAQGAAGEAAKHVSFEGYAGSPRVLLQRVDHDPRAHLDFETDDREAECAMPEKLGAKIVKRPGDWIVLEAPTSHRFCLVQPQGPDFPDKYPGVTRRFP